MAEIEKAERQTAAMQRMLDELKRGSERMLVRDVEVGTETDNRGTFTVELRIAKDAGASHGRAHDVQGASNISLAAGGGALPAQDEKTHLAEVLEKVIGQLRETSGAREDDYIAFARLAYSKSESSWDVRICPAVINGIDPKPHAVKKSADMANTMLNWKDFVGGVLRKQRIKSIVIEFGNVQDIHFGTKIKSCGSDAVQ
ncbi:Uncharacterised protein [uncultured archaeon]|nr:Uncharacterised protein [uncultured archaeon]